jgi:hypothetical protein
MDAEKIGVMKAFWNRIRNDVFIWLVFYFLFTLPFVVNWWEYFGALETSFPIGEPVALDHVGGSPAWYPYYYWYMGHRQSCFLFATIGWGIYKVINTLQKRSSMN